MAVAVAVADKNSTVCPSSNKLVVQAMSAKSRGSKAREVANEGTVADFAIFKRTF
jgi:hypothetical protein